MQRVDGNAVIPLDAIARDLRNGRTTCRALAEACLARAREPGGEGARVYLELRDDAIRAQADAADRALARNGPAANALCGMPIAIKDLFDVHGEVTAAGSRCLRTSAPASRDAAAVGRLRAAGAVLFGRTNMTELAYSGLGLNPHFGTPRNPFDGAVARIPGGSSSGAAVAVATGMAAAALGTDTGGSCRIPAALCGTVGFKPTHGRIPLDGVVPLASSYDCVGSLAARVVDCALIDAVLAGQHDDVPPALPLGGIRIAVPKNHVLEDADHAVLTAFDRALAALVAAGARLTEMSIRAFAALPGLGRDGGIVAAEAYAQHRGLLAAHGRELDARVRVRIEAAGARSAGDYQELRRMRAAFVAAFRDEVSDYDAVVMPTVPLLAPELAELERSDEAYFRTNALMVRNTLIANVLGAPAISVPCATAQPLPVGFMIMMPPGEDARLFGLARTVEAVFDAAERAGR